MALVIDACAAQHQGDRKEQQDRVLIVPHTNLRGVALAVVADGMGGHTGGALAADQMVHTARQNLTQFSPEEETPEKMLRSCLHEAHMLIKASRLMNEMNPHSTVVMMLIQPGRMSWLHCGDSRLYHFRDKALIGRTKDHSYVEQLLSRGRITPEQALVHPSRNVLLTSVGGNDEPLFDYAETTDLQSGDAYVLCSDGLWAYFSDEELGGIVASHTAREACEKLVDQARLRAGGHGDNLSIAIVKLKEKEVAAKPKPFPGFAGRPQQKVGSV